MVDKCTFSKLKYLMHDYLYLNCFVEFWIINVKMIQLK